MYCDEREMHDSIPQWMRDILVCVQCGHDGLAQISDAFLCSNCKSRFPVVNRVPMFLRQSSMIDAAASIADSLGGVKVQDVERAFGSALRYRMDDLWLRTEYSHIVERYPLRENQQQSEKVASRNTGHVRLLVDYFNPIFEKGEDNYRSFRIRNETGQMLASEGDRPFHISYWLTDSTGERREGVRSRFPVPLFPGKDLTVPVLIKAPGVSGEYKIDVMLVQEFVGWDEAAPIYSGVLKSVDVLPERKLVRSPHNGSFVFESDLEHCGNVISMAAEMVRSEAGSGPLTILEIACGSDPQTLRYYQANSNVIACDLAFPQVQLASLSWAKRGGIAIDRYAFASVDVFNPPFRRQAFDLVVVCAALHHFSDTSAALVKLVTLLKRNGKLVLLREPGKMAVDDPIFIKELTSGFNEQQFELAEYDVMYQRAGLTPCYQQLDFECSYKAILNPANPEVDALDWNVEGTRISPGGIPP
jgi:SAM-dependent methyltransferase